MESWDDDNFEPEVKLTATTAQSNKWEGEDEDEDIKESWEDEDEEKSEQLVEKAVQKPKKKPLGERIAEKQRLRQEDLEKRRAAVGENEEDEMTPEEKLRMQKESDLKLALETTFGDADILDIPTTSEEFNDFAESFAKKIQPLTKSTEFPNFAEKLVRSLCSTLSSLDIKKIKTTVENLYMEKQKLEKGDKAKKNKGKGKVKLKMDDSNQYSAYAVDDYDDFDDFM